jgi:hypothetical protein
MRSRAETLGVYWHLSVLVTAGLLLPMLVLACAIAGCKRWQRRAKRATVTRAHSWPMGPDARPSSMTHEAMLSWVRRERRAKAETGPDRGVSPSEKRR